MVAVRVWLAGSSKTLIKSGDAYGASDCQSEDGAQIRDGLIPDVAVSPAISSLDVPQRLKNECKNSESKQPPADSSEYGSSFHSLAAERRRCAASNGAAPLRVGTSGLFGFLFSNAVSASIAKDKCTYPTSNAK